MQNDVPLKTIDGGSTWVPLVNTPAKISQFGTGDAAHPRATLSWSGKTLVVSGADQSAIGRQERVSLSFMYSFNPHPHPNPHPNPNPVINSFSVRQPLLYPTFIILNACLVEYSAWADKTLLMYVHAVVCGVQEYRRWGVLDGRDRRYHHGLYGAWMLVREGLLPHNVWRGHHRQTQLRALNIEMRARWKDGGRLRLRASGEI